jgi:Ca2+-binding EF-hand superfamily protein
MKTHIFLLVVGPLLLSPALADDKQKETEQTQAKFEALDRDSDRLISQSEAKSNRDLSRRFAAVDANADGFVSASEYMARPSGERFE